jgi:hypothetical protein
MREENRWMGRLDADDGELAARFRLLDEASRRRVACSMVRLALRECVPPIALPHTAEQLLGTGGVATPAQLAELDRRAASSGGARTDDAVIRRHRAVQAARYALSPQPRAAEEALYEAIHASRSPPVAIEEARRRVH